ncbi:MAG: tetratricopeptide repeat protein [Planctomycetes bacterium]|nr:tetratricopeptide repeat protein [Planctomycetota bacterium]
MAKKRLNKKVAIIGSAVLAFFILGVIVVLLHFSKNPMKFLSDARAAVAIRDFKEAESNYRRAAGAAVKDDDLKIEILFEFADFFLTDSRDVPIDDPSYFEPHWQKRLACWTTILNTDPKNIKANKNLLEFYYDVADSGNSNVWERVKTNASELLELFEEKDIEIDPYVVRAKARALLAMASLGQTTDRESTLEDAIKELNRLKEMEPEDASTYRYLSEAALLEGTINRDKGVIGATESATEKAKGIMEECIEIVPDDVQSYTSLLELKRLDIDLSDPDTFESFESEMQALVKRFDSSAIAYASLSKFYTKPETYDKSLDAITKALELESENFEYALTAATFYSRAASLNNDMESIKKAISLVNGALEFPDTKETTGPRQFANKRNRLISYSLLSSWYITLALEAGQDGDESLKEPYITQAENSVHEIEQILGTGDNINMTKWNGLLELARGNKNAAIRQLYLAHEGFKAAGQADSLVAYHLAEIFKNRPEIGLKKEFLEYSISPQNNMVPSKPGILLDYAKVLYDLRSWANGIKITNFYENLFGVSKRSTLSKARGYIGAGMTAEAKELLEDLNQDDIETLRLTYRLYSARIANQLSSKNRQGLPDIFNVETNMKAVEPYDEAKHLDYRAKAMDTLVKLMEKDPGNIDRAMRICSNYIEKKEYEKAKTTLDNFLEISPENLNAKVLRATLDEPDPSSIAVERLNELSKEAIDEISDKGERATARALSYEKAGELDKSLDEFERAHKLLPDDSFVLSLYFNFAINNDKLSVAEDLVEEARRNNFDLCEGNLYAARLLLVQKLFQEAIGKLDYCIELQPTSEMSYLLRSSAHNELGNFEEAIVDMKVAQRINPLSPSTAKQSALLIYNRNRNLGQNVTAQQIAEAEQALVRASILNPKEHSIRSIYANYISERDPEKALTILGNLQNTFPTSGNVLQYAQLAQKTALSESNPRHKDALMEIAETSFKKAYDIDPENKNVLNAYSEFLRITGKGDQATEMLSKDTGVLWKFYLRDSQYEAAEKILLELYDENPEQLEVIKGLMLVATQTRSQEDIEKYSRKLLDIENNIANELYVIKMYLEVGLTEDAELKLDSFIERNSESSQAILLKSWIYLSKGQPETALETINLSLELEPENPSAWKLRGSIHRSMGQYDRALEDLQKSKNIHATASTRMELAKAYRSAGRVAAAIGELVEALKENQPPKAARSMLENMYIQSNRKRELKSFYTEILDKFPNDSYWYFRAGTFYLKEKDFAKAHNLLEKSLELSTTDFAIATALDIYLESLFEAGQYDKSLKIASGYIDKPQAPIAYAQMAQVKYKMGSRATGISYYRKAIEKAMDNDFYISGILENMLAIAGSGEVVKWCNEKLYADAHSYSANLMMFNLTQSSGDYNKALKHIDNILSTMEATDRSWLGNMMDKANTLIMAYMKTSDEKYLLEGIDIFEKILEIQPANSSVLNNLAYLLADNDQQLEKAVEYAERAYKASPNDGNNLDTYAFTLIKIGEYEKSIESLRTAIQIFERNSQNVAWGVYQHLGMAQEGLGDRGAAAASYRQALEVAGKNISDKDMDWLKKSIERVLQ